MQDKSENQLNQRLQKVLHTVVPKSAHSLFVATDIITKTKAGGRTLPYLMDL